jgi:hypothetical protein
MTTPRNGRQARPKVRCAIYTRKSTEEGLGDARRLAGAPARRPGSGRGAGVLVGGTNERPVHSASSGVRTHRDLT